MFEEGVTRASHVLHQIFGGKAHLFLDLFYHLITVFQIQMPE
jgi:hypothetical protein